MGRATGPPGARAPPVGAGRSRGLRWSPEVPLSRPYGEFGLLETRSALSPFECRYLASFGDPPRLVELRILSLNLQERGMVPEQAEERLASLRSLSHPYLPRVANAGVREDTAFYVTDPAPTQSFAEYLEGQRKGLVDPERAFDMLLPVGQAVALLHQNGIAHGDVSTRSIRVDPATERTFLGTYPLASILGIELPQTSFRELQETRAAGAATAGATPTPADDVRGFAAVLYQALTGTPVRPGATPPAPSTRCPLPPEADAILLSALAPDPAERTGTLQEVLDGLEPLKAAVAEVARQARAGRSAAIPVPDLDRRGGTERRKKKRRKVDEEDMAFLDRLALWLFDKGLVVNLVVFLAVALASFRSSLLVPDPPEFMSGEFQNRHLMVASGKFDAKKIQQDLLDSARAVLESPTEPLNYEERLRALRRFSKAVPKADKDKVFSRKEEGELRLMYGDDKKKACAKLDLLLRRAYEYFRAKKQDARGS